jgi:hypothetical protein
VRLLCDEMLAGLGRWLRAAGYDTALARPGAPDDDLLTQCEDEERVLLTADRKLAARPTQARVFLLENDFDKDAAILKRELDVDWLHDPFTRCVVDNTLLKPAGPADIERTPPESRRVGEPLRVCPRCGRVYWPGSHVRRMRSRLEAWAEGRASPSLVA